jgi:CheY-like chemotaxis protein
LTHVIPADGVGVWINGNQAFSGVTPPPEDFARIVRALNGTAAGKVFATDHIASIVPMAVSFASNAAGMLAIPISRSPRDYVVLFRSELIRSVRWGGDPHKPVEYGPNGPRLSPRESFAEWKELVEGRSKPFTTSELRVAETLRATLIEVVLRLADEASVERQQANERQELLIAELNHRVRNILGVIRGLIRQSKPKQGSSVEDFVARRWPNPRSRPRPQPDHRRPLGSGALRALIDAEAAAFLAERRDRVSVEGRPSAQPAGLFEHGAGVHELSPIRRNMEASPIHGTGFRISWRQAATMAISSSTGESAATAVSRPTSQGLRKHDHRSVHSRRSGWRRRRIRLSLGRGRRAEVPDSWQGTSQSRMDYSGPAIKLDRPQGSPMSQVPARVIDGKSVLLVEDSLIIALDAEDILKRLGAAEVVTTGTIEQALEVIEDLKPDMAMLDINLGDQTSYAIADRLSDLGIPFLFATGYGEQAQLPQDHEARTVVQKPYTLENVARVLPKLVRETA